MDPKLDPVSHQATVKTAAGRRSGPASDPEALGRALAGELIAGGAAEILAAIRRAGDAKP